MTQSNVRKSGCPSLTPAYLRRVGRPGGPYMQRAFPSEALERKLDTVRKPLGEVVSRKLKSAKFGKSVQQVSGGDYFKLRFNTSFSNRQHAVETVTPVLQKDGTWKVSGYYVDRSRAGIT